MAFIHAANVSIHEPSDYNPFRRQLTASQRQKLYLAFKHTLPYLSCAEYKSCAAVDTSFHQMIMQQLLEKPSFHDGHVHDALHLLVKWVDLLPHFRPETAALIKHLDVSHIEDSLYERVPSYFFEYLLRYTPNLQVLQLSRTSFLQCRNSLPPRYELRHLHTLDLSYCDNISSATLCALSARLPCLQHVKLDGIASNIDEGVAALAHRGELQSISMRNCSSISDVAMYSLAKFRTIKLKEIDVSGCRKITENGFLILAKYNIHLQLLGLDDTSCSGATMEKLLSACHRTLRSLDIAHHHQELDKEYPSLTKTIISLCHLERLEVSFNMMCSLLSYSNQELICTHDKFPELRWLYVHGLPESTSMQFIHRLIQLIPSLKHVTLTRDYYESDFLYGSYTTSPQTAKNGHTVITDAEIQKFNLSHRSQTIITLVHNRETVRDLGMNSW